jgi:hypothetical protein
MERVCRTCVRSYRGLVCQACHPRRKAKVENAVKAEVKVETETSKDEGLDACLQSTGNLSTGAT